MRKKKLIYIAMPYTASRAEGIAQNIENARQFVRENFPSDSEFFPVIPHNTGIGVEKLGGESYWYDATESLMLACSAVVLGPGWRDSRGARNELLAARRAGIPVVEAQLVGVGLVERLRIITDRKLGDMTLTDITEEYTRTAFPLCVHGLSLRRVNRSIEIMAIICRPTSYPCPQRRRCGSDQT